jgi:hypothetical protein
MKVAEPEPGRILTESDTGSSLVTTTMVSRQGGASIVQISTAWDGTGGIGGLFERTFAPKGGDHPVSGMRDAGSVAVSEGPGDAGFP